MLHLIDGNNVFRRRFETIGQAALNQMYSSACYLPHNTTQVWVWDGVNAKARRKAIFPDYKGNRPPTPDAFYQTVHTFKQLLKHSRSLQIEVPLWEADDVIATMALGSSQKVRIDSNDLDFAPLSCERIQTESDKVMPVPAHEIRLYKTLVGDKSDNIKGLPLFGDKAYLELNEAQKQSLTFFLQGRILYPDFGLLGWTDNRIAKFEESKELLQAYYQIVKLYTVPIEDIQQNVITGVHDVGKANDIFTELFLPTEVA